MFHLSLLEVPIKCLVGQMTCHLMWQILTRHKKNLFTLGHFNSQILTTIINTIKHGKSHDYCNLHIIFVLRLILNCEDLMTAWKKLNLSTRNKMSKPSNTQFAIWIDTPSPLFLKV